MSVLRALWGRILGGLEFWRARPTGHDCQQCPTCLRRDDEGYQRERLVRVHNRASSRLWLG